MASETAPTQGEAMLVLSIPTSIPRALYNEYGFVSGSRPSPYHRICLPHHSRNRPLNVSTSASIEYLLLEDFWCVELKIRVMSTRQVDDSLSQRLSRSWAGYP